jgi:DNA-binding NarL/FixJ family response regulator
MIKVVLADDHHLVRQGIRALLERDKRIQIVGEAPDGREALELITRHQPDVAIVDIRMPMPNGIMVIDQVQALKLPTKVIVLSMYDDDTLVRRALRHGASGYLLKYSVAEELPLAIHAAMQNQRYLSPAVSKAALADLLEEEMGKGDGKDRDPLDRLSPRERQVLQLLVEGYTNAAVANKLTISVKTVEKHRANVMNKLQAQDLVGLIRLAMKYRLIIPDEMPLAHET